MPRSLRQRLIASPACPAPTTMVVMSRTATAPRLRARSVHLDGDIGRVGDDIEDRRALLRLGDEGLDLILGSVGVDLVFDFDAVEAVAHIGIDAEDALEVHAPFDGCFDGAQLNPAVL